MRMRLNWSVRKSLLLAAALLVGLAVVTVVDWIFKPSFEQAVAELAATGVQLDIKKHTRPAIPEDENAATIIESFFAGAGYRGRVGSAASMIASAVLDQRDDVASSAAAEQLLRTEGAALDVAIRAARYPSCAFALDYPGLNLRYQYWLPNLADLLVLDMAVARARGDEPKAAERMASAIRLYRFLFEEPALPDHLALLLTKRSLVWCRATVSAGVFSEPSLRLIANEIGASDYWERSQSWLVLQRVIFVDMVRKVLKGDGLVIHPGGETYRILASPLRSNSRFIRAAIEDLNTVTEGIALIERPPWESLPALERLLALGREADRPEYAVSAGMGEFDKTVEAWAFAEVTKLGMLLKAYRLRKGQFPDELAQLMPHYVDELPLDPHTGKGFIYEQRDDSVVIGIANRDGTPDATGRSPAPGDGISWTLKR